MEELEREREFVSLFEVIGGVEKNVEHHKLVIKNENSEKSL